MNRDGFKLAAVIILVITILGGIALYYETKKSTSSPDQPDLVSSTSQATDTPDTNDASANAEAKNLSEWKKSQITYNGVTLSFKYPTDWISSIVSNAGEVSLETPETHNNKSCGYECEWPDEIHITLYKNWYSSPLKDHINSKWPSWSEWYPHVQYTTIGGYETIIGKGEKGRPPTLFEAYISAKGNIIWVMGNYREIEKEFDSILRSFEIN